MNMKKLVNDKASYTAFQEYVKARLEVCHQQLELTKEPADIYRMQGQIITWRRLQRLRDEVNGMED